MGSQNELERVIEELESFRDGITRYAARHIQIARERITAVRLLKKNLKDVEGLKMLSYSFRRDRKMQIVFKKNIDKLNKELPELVRVVSSNETLYEIAATLMYVVSTFKHKCKEIDYRLELGDRAIDHITSFASGGDSKYAKKAFKDYLTEWKKEIEFNQELIKPLVELESRDWFRQKKKDLQKKRKDIIGVSVALGLGAGYAAVAQANVASNPKKLLIIGTIAVFATLIGTLVAFKDFSKGMKPLYEEALADIAKQ